MPMREIEAKFTKSVLALYAWRSQEQYWQFKNRMAKHNVEDDEPEETDEEMDDVERVYDALDKNFNLDRKKETRRKKRIKRKVAGKVPQNLPDRFYDEEGNVNLSKCTGDDVLKYFAKQGIPLPIFGGRTR